MDVRAAWQAARSTSAYLHLDSGAAGRTSTATQLAVAAHAMVESERGAYVAQAEATDVLGSLRADLGGLLGVGPDDVGFVESASAALSQLLASWRLPTGAVVACTPSEWGPNLVAFRDHGLRLVHLLVADAGTVDVDALPRFLDSVRPALVHLTVAAAHRALVQPASAVVSVCRPRSLPVLCDLAQALGQVPVHHSGADAVYGTGRK